jgi:Calcium-dependent channel, 7TM region, putative phosphate
VSAGTLLQIATLILFYLMGKLFDSTPRNKWTRFNTLPGLGWGTTYPIFSSLAVIGNTSKENSDKRDVVCDHIAFDPYFRYDCFLPVLLYLSP